MLHALRHRLLCALPVAVGLPMTAHAQTDVGSETEGSDEDAVSSDEIEALMRAMQADDAAESVTTTTSAAAPSAGSPLSFLELALIVDVAAAFFDNVGQTWAGGHDPSRDGFTLQQLEMSIGAAIDPYFRFDSNLVFSEFGVEVEEAYATTTALPARLQLRAGQFLTRFGRLNPTHPHSWNFADQALVIGRFFGSEGGRGLGVDASWLAPLPWYVEPFVSVQYSPGECCARSVIDTEAPDGGPYGPIVTGGLRQFFALSPTWSLLAGLSAQTAPNETGAGNHTDIYGVDLFVKWRPVGSAQLTEASFQIEAMHRRRQVPYDLVADWGGYAELSYKPWRRWVFSTRHELVTANRRDPLDGSSPELTQRTSIATSFHPSHFSRLRLQGALVDRDGVLGWGSILQLEVVAGAHGAHAY